MWLWLVVDGLGWFWVVVGSFGWFWVVVNGFRLWVVLVGFGWLWVVLASFGQLLVVLTGFGWLWLVLGGFSWLSVLLLTWNCWYWRRKFTYLLNNLRNSNEIFTKHVTYDNINSQKNQGFTFSLENTCWKNHSGGSNWPPSHFTVNRKFSSYDLSLLHILRFKYNSNNRFFSTICFQVLIRPNKYFKQKYSKYFQGWNGIFVYDIKSSNFS